jgi:hypothetical protein
MAYTRAIFIFFTHVIKELGMRIRIATKYSAALGVKNN